VTFLEVLGVIAMITGMIISILAYMIADQANRRSAKNKVDMEILKTSLEWRDIKEKEVPNWETW
jgi:uncharacterized membrane protein (DUF106 family)